MTLCVIAIQLVFKVVHLSVDSYLLHCQKWNF